MERSKNSTIIKTNYNYEDYNPRDKFRIDEKTKVFNVVMAESLQPH